MKYFVLGALASGFLLYGLSMMYGATGSLDIRRGLQGHRHRPHQQGGADASAWSSSSPAWPSSSASVPFHMWVPDVYQGAPTAVTLLIGGAPKLAAFAITIRLLVEGMLGPGGRLAADADRAGRGLAGGRQPGGHRADQPEAHAGLLDHRADGLRAAGLERRRGQRQHAVGRQRLQLGDVLHGHLRAHHAGHLRPDPVPVARRASRARRSPTSPAWRSAARGWPA